MRRPTIHGPQGRTILLLLIMVSPSTPAFAQWSTHPTLNTPVVTAAGAQQFLTMVSDGAGGAIIAWEDRRTGVGPDHGDIYAQRLDAFGFPQWTPDGVAISKAANAQNSPVITSDGAGGAIIAWVDGRSATTNLAIYAQRIDAAGAPQWTADGVAISTAPNKKDYLDIVSDGAGGAIITWGDYRNGTDWDVYARRVNASGTVLWQNDGVPISVVAASFQDVPVIASDGAGGAIITWRDTRGGLATPPTGEDVYAQRIDASGNALWQGNGVAISQSTGSQSHPAILSDGAGGAIITWRDRRGTTLDIYAQRINASGSVLWQGNGVVIVTAQRDQQYQAMVNDGVGGAIIAWVDYRGTATNWDIYAQRINASGERQWPLTGVKISTTTRDIAGPPGIISDGAEGAIITYEAPGASQGDRDIRAQRVNASGTVVWQGNGVAVSTAAAGQVLPAIVSDGAGDAVVAWWDQRNGVNNLDIYAQKIDRHGQLGAVAPRIVAVTDVINDQGGKVTVTWGRSSLDVWPNQTVTSYMIWRGVKPTPTSPIYWEFVASVAAHWQLGYSYTVPTPADEGPQGIPLYYFMITAATADPLVYWDSQPVSGYSKVG